MRGELATERLREISSAAYVTRLIVRERGSVRPLRVWAVQHLEANDDYVTIHTTAGERFDVAVTMAALEGRLDPASFLRIHRRYVVNMDHVTSIVPVEGSRFEVRVRNGATLAAQPAALPATARKGLLIMVSAIVLSCVVSLVPVQAGSPFRTATCSDPRPRRARLICVETGTGSCARTMPSRTGHRVPERGSGARCWPTANPTPRKRRSSTPARIGRISGGRRKSRYRRRRGRVSMPCYRTDWS